jgi:hypothetical protein
MFRTPLLGGVVFSLILTSRRDIGDQIDTGIFYIGLGDQFDDDRRLVRKAASALRPAMPLRTQRTNPSEQQ